MIQLEMTLNEHLRRSAATAAFHDAIEAFLADGRPNDRIVFDPRCPAVKVERTLTKVLEEYPEEEIESVSISARSGCEFFRGEVAIRTRGEERRVNFDWDCKWKAVQQGWADYFGFPDQGRAAREFGHDCFRSWDEAVTLPLVEA
jgi:hypothetical protein